MEDWGRIHAPDYTFVEEPEETRADRKKEDQRRNSSRVSNRMLRHRRTCIQRGCRIFMERRPVMQDMVVEDKLIKFQWRIERRPVTTDVWIVSHSRLCRTARHNPVILGIEL